MQSIERHPTRSLSRRPAAVLLGSAFCFAASVAAAQAVSYKLHCHDVGFAAPEPLGDRDGHAVSVSSYTCSYEGGPWDGAMMTGTNIWEWEKGQATLLAGSGVTRKPGATNAWQNSEGKLAFTMAADGKVAGWTASGKGSMRMATGSAAGYSGQPYTWTAVPTAPGRFQVDVRFP